MAFGLYETPCTRSHSATKERQGPISPIQRMAQHQSSHSGAPEKITGKPATTTQSMLFLALAAMQEARITGEHLHYYPAAFKTCLGYIDQEPTWL